MDESPGGTTPDPIPFVHDAAGNLTDDGERTYVYDAWNRIVKAEQGGTQIAKYTYDAIGRRITATIGSGTTPTDYYYYDGHRDLDHYKRNGETLSRHRTYFYGPDYIDEVLAFVDDDLAEINFVIQDANYNVVGVVDFFGELIQQYSYKPYGGRLVVEDGNGASIDIENFPDQLLTTKGHQGLHHMPEIGKRSVNPVFNLTSV